MAVHIDVVANIRERDLRRETDRLANELDAAGATAGNRWSVGFSRGILQSSPKVQKAFHDVEDATARAAAAQNKYDKTSVLIGPQTERNAKAAAKLARARRAEADAHRAAALAVRDSVKSMQELDTGLTAIDDSLKRLGRTALPVARGMLVIAAPAVIGFLAETATAAVTASQALALLPAVATAAAAGFGTLQLATQGFGQAIKDIRDTKKFNEDLRSLSPNAQQAALSLRNLLPQFDALQRATQDTFFAGFSDKLQQLASTFGPGVQGLTTGIARSMNEALTGVANTLMTPQNQSNVANIMNNIGAAFKAAAPAAQQFAQAFIDITSVGSDFLPSLGESITTVATQFADFIREARQSGQLKQWIQEGIDAARELGGAVLDIGKFLYSVFGGGSKGEVQAWRNQIRDALNILGPILETINLGMKAFNSNIADSGKSLTELINPLSIIRDLVNSIRWFFDPNYRAQSSAIQQATDKLNAERAKHGLSAVDTNGNPIADGGPPSSGSAPGFGTQPGPRSPGNGLTWRPGFGWVVTGPGLPIPGSTDSQFPTPALGNGIGSAFNTPRSWQAERGPGNSIGGSSGSGKGPKGPDWSAPPDQWSLNNIPIGSFPGVGLPAGMPRMGALPGTPGGPPIGSQGPVDPQAAWDAQSRLQSAGFRVEETRQRYLELAHSNTASETDLLKSKHDIAESERDYISAQMKANETLQGKYKDLTSGMEDIGVALDKDLGISKGLPGIAENLIRFVASLAMAPLLGKLSADVANDPHKGGYGLMGILGAQGAFGPAFTGLEDPSQTNGGATSASQYTASGVAQTAVNHAGGITPAGTSGDAAVLPGLSGNGDGSGGLNLSTIPVAAQKYANDCIDASARIILSHSGINKTEDELKNIITPGGSINSLAAGLNQLDPQGNFTAMQGSGGSPQAMFGAIKASIDKGTGSILNVAPGSSLAGHTFAPGHFIAATGYNPDGTINVSDTAGGTKYSVSQADAFQATRGRGIVAGTGTGPPPIGSAPMPVPLPVTIVGGAGGVTAPGGTPGGISGGGGGLNWDALAAKEAGGNWANKSNSKYKGGLQFDQGTWNSYKPAGAPDNPADATKEQQIAAGQNALNSGRTPQSLWPTNYGQLGLPPSLPGAGQGGPMPTTPINPFGTPGLPNVSGTAIVPHGATSEPNGSSGITGPAGTPIISPSGSDPFFPNIGPGPLQVGPPGGAMSPAPGQIGPFPVPPSVAAMPGTPGASATAPLTPGANTGSSGWGAPPTPAGTGPTPIGGLAPPGSISPGGGIGITPGGTIDTAINAAASMVPGLGQAAATGIKLANRAIQYGAQLGGIGVQGLMETFLPTGGSELANNGWLPRIVGAVAGAAPALPNIAGGKSGNGGPPGPLTPEQAQQQQGQTAPAGQGPNLDITVNNNNASPDQNGRAIAWHAQQASLPPANNRKPGT